MSPMLGDSERETFADLFVAFVDEHREIIIWYLFMLALMVLSNIFSFILMKMEKNKYTVG